MACVSYPPHQWHWTLEVKCQQKDISGHQCKFHSIEQYLDYSEAHTHMIRWLNANIQSAKKGVVLVHPVSFKLSAERCPG